MVKKKVMPRKKKEVESKAERLQKMNDKFLPEEGFKFSKMVDKKNESLMVTYNLKGDSRILEYIENRIYDAITMVSDGVIEFDLVQDPSNNATYTIIKDSNKSMYTKNGFNLNIGKFVFIDLAFELDNMLQLKIIFENKNIDGVDVNTLNVVEYVLSAIEERFDDIKSVVSVIDDIMNSNELIKNIDINALADPYLFLKYEDIEELDQK